MRICDIGRWTLDRGVPDIDCWTLDRVMPDVWHWLLDPWPRLPHLWLCRHRPLDPWPRYVELVIENRWILDRGMCDCDRWTYGRGNCALILLCVWNKDVFQKKANILSSRLPCWFLRNFFCLLYAGYDSLVCWLLCSLSIYRISVVTLLSVLYALHTQYIFRTDPLFSGVCVSCRAGTPRWVEDSIEDVPVQMASSICSRSAAESELVCYAFWITLETLQTASWVLVVSL